MLGVSYGSESFTVDVEDSLVFGRGSAADGVDLTLSDDQRLHRHAGRITAHESSWTLDNLGRWLRLSLVSTDGAGQDVLTPGESRVIPWANVDIRLPLGAEELVLSVRTLAVPTRQPSVISPESGTIQPFEIDRSTGYFRALVALCEAQLVDPSSDAAPTDAQVAVRLNNARAEPRHLTAKGVERRLDYVRTRYGLKHSVDGLRGQGTERADARRELVRIALATGIVRPTDIRLLDNESETGPDTP